MSDFEMGLQNRNLPQNAAVQTAVGRYSQEVQGMVFCAKQFPRDQYAAWDRIKVACQRKTLAEISCYAYPRGGEKVTGPSIRLAEVLAQNWGNMSYGVTELEQRMGESTCMAYAWDLETNVRSEKIFNVKHELKLKNGNMKKLTDPRDVYELVANYGARRQRACILAIIPKDVVDAAVEECEKTMTGNSKEPLVDRIKKLLDRFKEFGVTKEMVEKYVGYSIDLFTAKDGSNLMKIFNSIKDGIGKREDYFEVGSATANRKSANDDIAKEFEEKQKQANAGNTDNIAGDTGAAVGGSVTGINTEGQAEFDFGGEGDGNDNPTN